MIRSFDTTSPAVLARQLEEMERSVYKRASDVAAASQPLGQKRRLTRGTHALQNGDTAVCFPAGGTIILHLPTPTERHTVTVVVRTSGTVSVQPLTGTLDNSTSATNYTTQGLRKLEADGEGWWSV